MRTLSANSKDRLGPRSRRLDALGAAGAKVALLSLISAYRVAMRPLVGPACRFAPSCSEYADFAIRSHGPRVGTRLAIRRLLRCHPWNPGGYDPVPERNR
jgi:hypothetical protein